MILEEFLVMLGAETETDQVRSFGDALAKVASVGAVVVGALKAVSLAAWGFADGYIRRAEELASANSDLYTITKEQVEMSKKYEDGMGKLGKIIESVKIKVAFGFLPTMLDMVNTFNEFLDANKDLIANGITKLLEVVSKVSQVINNTVRFIVKIIEATIGWKGALIVLIGVFVWLKRAMLLAFVTNPIFWVIAAIGVLMLLIDDFMTYLDGGESQLGDFWGSLLNWIDKAKKWWADFSQSAIDSYNNVVDATASMIESIVAAVTPIYNFFKSIFNSIGEIIDGYIKVWSGIFGFASAAWRGDVQGARDAIAEIFDGFGEIFDGVTQYFITAWEGAVAVATSIIDAFTSIIKASISGWISIFSALVEFIPKAFDTAINLAKGIFTGFFSWGIDAASSFVTGIGNVFHVISELIKAPFAEAFDWVSSKFDGVINMIRNGINGAKSALSLGGASSVSNTTNSGGNMTIHAPMTITSNNPVAAGRAVQSGLGSTMNQAKRNMGGAPKA